MLLTTVGLYYKHFTIANDDSSGVCNRSFILANFVSETVNDRDSDSDSDMKQCLPWPPWVTQQEIETILSLSHRPR